MKKIISLFLIVALISVICVSMPLVALAAANDNNVTVTDFTDNNGGFYYGASVDDPTDSSNKVYNNSTTATNPYSADVFKNCKTFTGYGYINFDFYITEFDNMASILEFTVRFNNSASSQTTVSIFKIGKDPHKLRLWGLDSTVDGVSQSSNTWGYVGPAFTAEKWYSVNCYYDTVSNSLYIKYGERGAAEKTTVVMQNFITLSSGVSCTGAGLLQIQPTFDGFYLDNIETGYIPSFKDYVFAAGSAEDLENRLNEYVAYGAYTYPDEFTALAEEKQEKVINKIYPSLTGFTDAAAFNEQLSTIAKNIDALDYELSINSYDAGNRQVFCYDKGSLKTNLSFINNTPGDFPVTFISAVYGENGELLKVTKTTSTAQANSTTEVPLTSTLPNSESKHMKLFAFNSLSKLVPYCEPFSIPKKSADTPILYLVGDSLCAEYGESSYPYQGWGHYMEENLTGITVSNRAVAGWTTDHFLYPEDRGITSGTKYDFNAWKNIKAVLKPGDYVLISLGINDSGSGNVSEEKYVENLEIMYNDTVNAGATPIFATPTIYSGAEDSTGGWTYSIESGWGKRGEVCRVFAESKGAVCLPVGSELSALYEEMYQAYKNGNTNASEAECRNYVRYYFHLFHTNLKADSSAVPEGWNITEEKIAGHPQPVKNGDDTTHMNERGAERLAQLICELIEASDSTLADYVIK